MENKYKIIISNPNFYREVELPADGRVFRLGAEKDCDVRVLKSFLQEPLDIALDFVFQDGNWQVQCSDGIYITETGTEKLYVKNLRHGDVLSVKYDESNNTVFTLDYLIDFESARISYSRKIDLSSAGSFVLGSDPDADIYLDSPYVEGDRIEAEQYLYSLQLTVQRSRYGVYHNGSKAGKTEIIRDGDFFSISDFFFYYKEGCLWTEIRDDLEVRSFPASDDPLFLTSYPQFNRSTRIKSQINEEKIEILAPPEKPQKPKNNFLMQLLPSLGMLITSAVMGMVTLAVVSAGMAIFMAVARLIQNRREFKKELADREEKYNAYIQKKREEISQYREEERRTLEDIYISQEEELQRLETFSPQLFDRSAEDEDFLCVRLGSGDFLAKREIDFKKQERLEVADELQQLPEQVYEEFKYLRDGPVVCDFKSVNAVGFVGAEEERFELFKNMVIDIAARQYPADVSMVFIASEEHAERVNWLRFLPHAFNKSAGVRSIVCDEESKNFVFEYLYKELSARSQQKGRRESHIVIVFYDMCGFNMHPISKFVERAKEIGVTFVFFAEDQFALPLHCGYIVRGAGAGEAELMDAENSANNVRFAYPHLDDAKAQNIVAMLAPVHTEEISLASELVKSFTMFELLNIMTAEDLDLDSRWGASQVTKSMAAPIGVAKSGIVKLDLHEKAHGPHGLVAGTTGSGKSELLVTYVLSIATLFHPYEVSFLIIDFKGGGMGNQLRDLPHLLGVITNIDGREINRSLRSIEAEIKRRQRLFAEAGDVQGGVQVNHIDQYIQLYKEGKVPTPLPHLIIIVDEFAELKAQQPDFMDALISAARVGRSLGIHLILATQKPSGQVNDQIWSNSRFKLCLKVQSQSDSNEVIKSPLAAEIKEPGRAYLQVGNNEIFELFQSGYSGAPADTSGVKATSKYEITEITPSQKRQVLFTSQPAHTENSHAESQLQAIVEFVANYCREKDIAPLPEVFKPPLPEVIPYRSGGTVSDSVCVSIGIYDDPDTQTQGETEIYLSEENLLIIGSAQTGKTNLLQTIIRQLCTNYSPKQVAIYVADFGSMSLKNFEKLPHVGGVVALYEEERFKNLLKLLVEEIEERRQKLLAVGLSSYRNYLESGREDLPLIVFIMDNLSAFKDYFSEQYEGTLFSLLQEGQTYGISVILSNSSTNGISSKYLLGIGYRIAFHCNRNSEYSDIFGFCRMEPKDTPGRGLFASDKTIYEFQSYLSFSGEKEIERIEEIKDFVENTISRYEFSRVKSIPSVPNQVSVRYLQDNYRLNNVSENIYFAINYETIECMGINCYDQFILAVLGKNQQQRLQCVSALMNDLRIHILQRPVRLYIIDNFKKELIPYRDMPYTERYTVSAERFPEILEDVFTELKERYEILEEEGVESFAQMPWLVVVINNRQALEIRSCDEQFEEISKRYANLKILFLVTDISDKRTSGGVSKMLRLLSDERKVLYFGAANELKLIDVSGSTMRALGALTGRDDAYLINGDSAYRVKTIQGV